MWRNTGQPVRIFMLDARACLPIVCAAVYWSWPTLYIGVIGFAFFVLQKVSLALGSGGYLPAWLAAWLPNLIFGVLGLALLLRVR